MPKCESVVCFVLLCCAVLCCDKPDEGKIAIVANRRLMIVHGFGFFFLGGSANIGVCVRIYTCNGNARG